MIQPQNIFWAVKCRSRLQLCISRDKGLLSSDLSLICSICELKHSWMSAGPLCFPYRKWSSTSACLREMVWYEDNEKTELVPGAWGQAGVQLLMNWIALGKSLCSLLLKWPICKLRTADVCNPPGSPQVAKAIWPEESVTTPLPNHLESLFDSTNVIPESLCYLRVKSSNRNWTVVCPNSFYKGKFYHL